MILEIPSFNPQQVLDKCNLFDGGVKIEKDMGDWAYMVRAGAISDILHGASDGVILWMKWSLKNPFKEIESPDFDLDQVRFDTMKKGECWNPVFTIKDNTFRIKCDDRFTSLSASVEIS